MPDEKTPETAPDGASAEAETAGAETAGEKTSLDDDTRRKFEEALSRKHGATAAAKGHRTAGNVHMPDGNAKTQRMFRRKSGG